MHGGAHGRGCKHCNPLSPKPTPLSDLKQSLIPQLSTFNPSHEGFCPLEVQTGPVSPFSATALICKEDSGGLEGGGLR